MCDDHLERSMDQPVKVADSARGQLKGKMNISVSPFAPDNFVSRDGLGRPVLRQLAQSSAH